MTSAGRLGSGGRGLLAVARAHWRLPVLVVGEAVAVARVVAGIREADTPAAGAVARVEQTESVDGAVVEVVVVGEAVVPLVVAPAVSVCLGLYFVQGCL